MERRNIVVLIIFAVVVTIGILFSSSMNLFSVIGEFEGTKTCEILDVSGGECSYTMTLPQNRDISSYTLDIDFEHQLSDELLGRTVLTPFISGTYTAEWNKDLSTSLQDIETNYLYLYRIPDTWINIDGIHIEGYGTDASCRTREDRSGCKVDIDVGVVDVVYPYTNIQSCNQRYLESCTNGDVAIAHNYLRIYSGAPNEMRFSLKNVKHVTPIPDGVKTISSYGKKNIWYQGEFFRKGDVTFSELQTTFEKNSDIALFALVEATKDKKGYVDLNVVLPPTVYASYKKNYNPSHVQIFINGELLQTLEGEQEDATTTRDFSNKINEVCQRQINSSTCDFELKITSASSGVIKILEENTEVGVVVGTENDVEGLKKNTNWFFWIMITIWMAILTFIITVSRSNK